MKPLKRALANFRMQAGKASDGVLGGFITADGTVDFVPFTRSGFHGHSDALRAGAIPGDVRGGFSISVQAGRILDWNFNSVLNGPGVRLPKDMERAIREALAYVVQKSTGLEA